MTTMCFTGHRPNKLGGYDWKSDKNRRIMNKMYYQIEEIIINRNVKRFIFGGAIGIDQMSFEVVKKLKEKKFNDIEMIVAVPFKNQYIKWFDKSNVEKYMEQLEFANEVIYVDEVDGYKFDRVKVGTYNVAKMQLRNRYMVDNSNIVFAVWDGTKGGTGNCVKYAKKVSKEIITLDPSLI